MNDFNSPDQHQGKRIFVIMGTDVHPFSRLCSWADQWIRTRPTDHVLVQHGYTPPPAIAQGVEILSPEELGRTLATTDVAISHGGPGTISAIRTAGLQPIVFPRDPEHGEHVDGHQMRFAKWASDRGIATVAFDLEQLDSAVRKALSQPQETVGPSAQIESSLRALRTEIVRTLRSGPRRRRIGMLRGRPTS